MRIQHVQLSLPVGQLAGARDFYCRVLGLEEIHRPEGISQRPGLWLRVGQSQEIHLAEEAGINPAQSKAHVAFEVENLVAWQKKLESKGVALQMHPSGTRFHVRDPYGNRIELLESRALKTEEDFQISFSAGELERILCQIEEHVSKLLLGDQKKLMDWLYRLDVAEKSVQAILKNSAENRWAQRISELVFQRELQKYFNQRKSHA